MFMHVYLIDSGFCTVSITAPTMLAAYTLFLEQHPMLPIINITLVN